MAPDIPISGQLYQDIFENAPFGLYTLDKDGYITSFNPKMAEIAGDNPNDVVGLNVFEMDSYQKAGLTQFFADGIQGRPFETEVSYVSYLGNKLSLRHYRGIPVQGGNQPGQTRLLLLVEDVTEKRQTEARLEESRQEERLEHERLRLLINSMADAVIATDKDGRIVVYNGAALELLNTNQTLENQSLVNYLHTFDQSKKPVNLFDLVRQEERIVKRDDILLQISDQDYLNLYVSISPIYVSYGAKADEGFMFLLRDITREKSVEMMRDEFVSVISHELRTPIAVAEANISTAMISDVSKNTEQVMGMLNQAHQSIIFLASLVNDLTTLAKAERGLLEIGLSEVNPQEVVKQVQSDSQKAAVDKGLEVKTEIDPTSQPIQSSKYHVQEILENFATNAIKYTLQGAITIGVRPSPRYVGGLQFYVRDTGVGLSAHDKKKIFEKFFRVEDYRTRKTGGTGLGLYISKKMSERLGGQITFDSILDKGSVFCLDVPPVDAKGKPVIPEQTPVTDQNL